MKSAYKILEKENLIIEVHSGTCNSDSFQFFKSKLAEDPYFHKDFKFLVHIKNLKFETTMDDIDQLAHFIKNKEAKFGKRTVGILTETPEQVVTSTLYMTLFSKEANDVKVFSTNRETLKFLKINSNKFPFIESILQDLKQSLN